MSNESPPVTPQQLAAFFASPEAGTIFAEFMASRLGATAAPKPMVPELWRRYEAHGTTPTDGGRTRIKSWNTGPRYHARRLLEFFGAKAWDEVTHELADEYRRWRKTHVGGRGQVIASATINRELRSLQSCFSFAVKKRIIARNPLAAMANDPVVHQRDFTITQDQFKQILVHARPILRYFLLLLYETGMRRDEVRGLRWTEVDLDRGFITLPGHRTKNGKERPVPLSAVARMVLENQPRDPVNPHVFPNTGQPTGGLCKVSLWRWFKEARDAAGVTGPQGQPVWMHTLRHTYATDLATSGVPVHVVMAICGWTDPNVMQMYINVADRHKDDAKTTMDERSASLLAQAPARRAARRTATSSQVRGPAVAPKKASG